MHFSPALRHHGHLALIALFSLVLLACSPKNEIAPSSTAKTISPSSFAGDWGGNLKTPVGKRALVLHVREQGGAMSATLDSPDQNAFGIKAGSAQVEADALVVHIKALRVKMVLRARDKDTLSGKFYQGSGLDLILNRQTGKDMHAGKNRPQTPAPPFPYETQGVHVHSGGGVLLGGTLVLPKGAGPFPAVVMISGSGPQDRDETIMGHKPFFVLADALARSGIASLRADDRGVAGSTGDFAQATEQDFAADAKALRRFLAQRADIVQTKVGYLGHSEGGIIAPMAASNADDIAFLALIAGPALPLSDIVLEQIKTFTPDAAAQKIALAAQEKIYAVLRSDAPADVLQTRIISIIMASGADADTAKLQARRAASPWMRDALDRDAGALIERLDLPVLAIYGTLDTQVPAALNAPRMRVALSGKNPLNKVVVLNGLNHLMQPAKTGMPDEYSDIETTMAPAALTLIVNWIKAQSAD